MALAGTGRQRALALPVGLALTASLGFLTPAAATAAPAEAVAAPVTSTVGPKLSYVVNVKGGPYTAKTVKKAIANAGGSIVIAYDQIGVIVVHSQNPDFATAIRRVDGVVSAGATRTAPIAPAADTAIDSQRPLTSAEAEAAAARAGEGEDPLAPLLWGLPAIKADQAHKKTLGSKRVTVAVIDTGVDDTHPDLQANFDRRSSANCVSGKPDTTEGAWRPAPGESPHGTHVAGTIAAAKNDIGVVGVAPGVKVSGIKVSTPAGFFYTEAVVCAFIWAAEKGAEVTNSSFYVDPWLFNCKNDPDQLALVEAVQRATRYAERKGSVNVAAAGNSSMDLASAQLTDVSSPNDSTPGTRSIDPSECLDIPTQLPGVVTTSSLGAKGLKSSFSNHGNGVVDISAPGGDRTAFQKPDAPAADGRILSTGMNGEYIYMAGTSMASPHVAGVAALVKSKHPYASPAAVKALLYAQADDRECTNPYDINNDGKIDAVCEGDKAKNGFYGTGVVDALDAVRR
ncbi:S8 family peptidase [Streptomyces clavuligerus]|uniref:Putative secreted subtilisin-like serine protease n=1 Tax=Streptomyces clavuligerus TaxID=1901 RepID=E2PXJ5_STRCL|nr:S8 family serine peptidase [Streptomyces clavuligerus]ANW20840.1 peptidase S8 [Streptomyces clavuligerus]AXU15466.1 peptidase S8 [Streptomyces clavuligerus]EFG06117.1 Putative secreted subtilisin-like serine protease [Streptomyces clavuligerus]MBY6305562.1 S8 family serine peptidase [Streptomyces clavuligerus]QCS08242.1 peptidase S8 [Streptomyces clavuligerus]